MELPSVTVASHLRTITGDFIPIAQVESYDGDCDHMAGAVVISSRIGEFMTTAMWDDLNWIWPLLVQALDEARTHETGMRWFPGQPLKFTAELTADGSELVMSLKGGSTNAGMQVDAPIFYRTFRDAFNECVEHLERLCPGSAALYRSEIRMTDAWTDGRSSEST